MRRLGSDAGEWIGALYDRHAAGLYRYAVMLLADPDGASDAMQQVFTRLLQGTPPALENEGHYLRRAVRNECFTMLRTRRRDLRADPQPILEALHADDDQPEARLAIERALRDLPAEQREVIHLKVFEGMTFQEIAELTNESINTIASRYRYALEKLKAILKR